MSVPANIIVDGDNYHLGTIFDGQAPVNDDGYTVGTNVVPFHGWLQEWNDAPSPLLVRLPQDIVAARLMFPYGDTGCKYNNVTAKPYTIMGPSSITKYMPQTGERPDIGLITDWSAWWMLTGDGYPMLQIAQAAASCPMHYRDENTGRPIDLLKYPTANCYSQNNQGKPWMPSGPIVNGYPQPPDGWRPQQAHYCEMSYLAYCATRNVRFLRDTQYSANFMVLCDAWLSGQRKIATIYGEYRGVAWAFRNLFMAHAATLDAETLGILPDSCMLSGYWETVLGNQLVYYDQYRANPANQYFRLIATPGRFAPWQVDYMLTALAFGVLSGHTAWTPLYIWALKNALDRTSGLTGYPPGLGTAYYLEGPDWATAVRNLVGAPEGGITQTQYDALMADPLNGGKAMQGQEYMMTTRAALVMADYLDKLKLAPVRATYPEFDAALANAQRMFLNYGRVNPRVSVISIGGNMPATVTMDVGQSVPINLSFTDGAPNAVPTYTQTDAIGTISDMTLTGAVFNASAPGHTSITVHTQGKNGEITDTGEVIVNSPLPTAVALSFGTPS